MSFHFASTEYASCFRDLPQPDPDALRQQALSYLDSMDRDLWYKQPVCISRFVCVVNHIIWVHVHCFSSTDSILTPVSLTQQIVSLLKGQPLHGPNEIDTVDGIGQVNGRQNLAGPTELAALVDHITNYKQSNTDYRTAVRQVEEKLFTEYAGFLIGNQCIDFQKQDGVTEIEESIMANTVERRLNDLLWRDVQAGHVTLHSAPIFVGAVSNFTNFLDLSRKTLRSLELGIPVVVLGRTRVAQHSFRWTELLLRLLVEKGVDPGMLTFASCDIDGLRTLTQQTAQTAGNLYITCSRALAAEIKQSYPNVIASTGGPNTLVSTEWTEGVSSAVATSAAIECAGQCTALRHCVVPSDTEDGTLARTFDNLSAIETAESAMQNGIFTGVFSGHTATPTPEDVPKHQAVDAFWQARKEELPGAGIDEYWRKVVVDFTKMDLVDRTKPRSPVKMEKLMQVARWLNTNQPISLAVNGPRSESLKVGIKLWEETGLVVNTIGSTDETTMPPALTCQARPQEGEVFGEFPPRPTMELYSKFPVIVPSSNPSYDACYSPSHLQAKGTAPLADSLPKSTRTLLEAIQEDAVRGYCILLIKYLQNVCRMNPKQGSGKDRTSLFGLQRPPLSTRAIVRVDAGHDDWDKIAPMVLLYFVTNARDQLDLSVDSSCTNVQAIVSGMLPNVVVESESELEKRASQCREGIFATFQPLQLGSFPMVGNFVSLYLPMGHIKSTKPDDEEFVLNARLSQKWLNTLF